MPKGDTRAPKRTMSQKREQYLGRQGAMDPYLTFEESKILRGQDTGMDQVKIGTNTSAFRLNEERAKDARNWEYWYKKEYGTEPIEGYSRIWGGGKGGGEFLRSKQSQAIDSSRTKAKRDGQIQYDIDQLRAETKRLQDLTAYREEASTPFSSQKAAMSLRASQARTRRGQARGLGLRRRSYNRVANLG